MNLNNIKIFETPYDLSESLANEFLKNSKGKNIYNIALAGGSTPKIFYETLAEDQFKNNMNWERIHLFWGDERSVAPDDPESNYLMTKNSLLDKIKVSPKNIHRIHGEKEPELEVNRYSKEILSNVPLINGYPQFDWIILGLGNDGHTASLFPNTENLKLEDKVCVVASHPESGQKRISLTIPVLANAKKISFLVTGENKSEILKKILLDKIVSSKYPASLLYAKRNDSEWYLDKLSSSKIT